MPASQELIQHWILNTAIEFPGRLSDFVPFVESEFLNVGEVPGATPDEHAAAFHTLLDTGLVQAFAIRNGDESETLLDRQTVEAIIQERLHLPHVSSRRRLGTKQPRPSISAPDLRWKMTALGGDAWERLAQPDWNRYALTLTDIPPTDPLTGEIWSASRDLLMANLGWYRELNEATVVRDTIRVEALHNHPITYWKVLPLVYHASFSCTDFFLSCGPTEQPEWFQQWWRSLDQWYKKPWEVPGWPTAEAG